MYDDKGNITREGAEQVIREGGTVSINGKTYQTIDSLPDEASFAAGNPGAEAGVRDRLAKQIADAQAQLARLGPAPSGGNVSEVGGKKAGDLTEGDGPNAGRRSGKS